MTIKKCDRCGKEIHDSPISNVIYPEYRIECYESSLIDYRVDLCDNCTKEFTKFLEHKFEYNSQQSTIPGPFDDIE